jgi:hypothetical protein
MAVAPHPLLRPVGPESTHPVMSVNRHRCSPCHARSACRITATLDGEVPSRGGYRKCSPHRRKSLVESIIYSSLKPPNNIPAGFPIRHPCAYPVAPAESPAHCGICTGSKASRGGVADTLATLRLAIVCISRPPGRGMGLTVIEARSRRALQWRSHLKSPEGSPTMRPPRARYALGNREDARDVSALSEHATDAGTLGIVSRAVAGERPRACLHWAKG